MRVSPQIRLFRTVRILKGSVESEVHFHPLRAVPAAIQTRIQTLKMRMALWRTTSTTTTTMLSTILMSLVRRRYMYLPNFSFLTLLFFIDPQVATVATLTNTANAILL